MHLLRGEAQLSETTLARAADDVARIDRHASATPCSKGEKATRPSGCDFAPAGSSATSAFETMPTIDIATLKASASDLDQRYDAFKAKKLALDMTRGKPCAEQLDLSNALLTNLGPA